MGAGALDGVRVLELGQFLSAPRAGRILAEQGAEVIKIEPPHGEQMRMLMTLAGAEKSLAVINGGKKGMTLDLKSPAGKELFLDLVKKSDVVLENFAPGALEKLGIGWEVLREVNPRVILASISGFGQTGPKREKVAFDIIAQASAGIMDGLHQPDRPPAVFFGDLISGGYCAMAIGFALFQRERTGAGQHLDVSMQDVMYAHHFHAHNTRALGDDEVKVAEVLGRPLGELISSPDHPLPFWNVYRCADGNLAVVALTDPQWDRLMGVIGRDDVVGDGRFDNFVLRVHNAAAGCALVDGWMQSKTVEDAEAALVEARIPCAPIADTDAVNADPHLVARGMLGDGEIPTPGAAIRTHGAPVLRAAHPGLGEHTEDVLREVLSLDSARIEALRSSGAI
jgi:formyl-CoA transferase